MKLSVIGLGKLGLCTAAYFASKGHTVIGVEKNKYFASELGRKRCPTRETGLANLLDRAWDNFEVTTNLIDAIFHSDVTLIIVPTPSKPDGKFSNENVEDVLCGIGPVLTSKDNFHVVNVVSTVMPGSCEKFFKPLLEELSRKVCGEDFGLVYNPEFIALGSVIHDFSRPDMVLIGTSDEKSAGIVKELYVSSCENKPHIATMSLLNAEITKLSLNCFLTTKISFANELANICERISGADVDEITKAIGADSRIGSKYLRGGLGFGGTCFPRDNLAFQAFTKEIGYEAKLSKATVAINDSRVDKLFEIIEAKVTERKHIALLGLSYKPNTHITEESQSIMLAQKLIDAGYAVTVYDPAALDNAKDVLGDKVRYCKDPYECVDGSDAIVLLTKWPEFRDLDWNKLEKNVKEGVVLLDSWRELKNKKFTKLNYVGLGLGCTEKM
jgi:UDPglucose 6-dehydrogenase